MDTIVSCYLVGLLVKQRVDVWKALPAQQVGLRHYEHKALIEWMLLEKTNQLNFIAYRTVLARAYVAIL